MAIRHKAWAPKVPSPPVRIVRMSGPALQFGMKEYSISGATLPVFSPAKTVADCFKFRSKVGLDVAIEALKECRRRKKASMDELAAPAKGAASPTSCALIWSPSSYGPGTAVNCSTMTTFLAHSGR